MSLSKFNHGCSNLIFAPFMMPEELWPEDRLNIQWKSMANYDISTMTNVIKSAIKDRSRPRNILISSYQRFVGGHDVQKIIEHLNEIVDLAMAQSYHTVIIGTCYFVPNHMAVWGAVSLLNLEIQRLCDKMSVPRANLHKHLMRDVGKDDKASKEDKARMTRPSCWIEYQLGLSLGLTLSWEGLVKYKTCILRVFDYSFARNMYRRPSQPPKPDMPPSLGKTPGYPQDLFMVQIMEMKRLIPVRTPGDPDFDPNERKLKCSDDRSSGSWKYWRVYKDNGPMFSFESREGYLEGYQMRMRRSTSSFEWDEMEEDTQQQGQQAEGSADESIEEPVNEVRQVSLGEEIENDDVFFEEKKGEKQKEKRNENEYKRLRQDLAEKSRLLKVEQEKVRSYRKDADNKEASLAKERALAKHWKESAEKEKEKNEVLSKSLEEELKSAKHVKRQNKRIVQEYYYLRNLYDSERTNVRKPSRSRAGMCYAKDKDMNECSDNDGASNDESNLVFLFE